MAKLFGIETVKVADAMAVRIAAQVENPAMWMLAVRRVSDMLSLDVCCSINPSASSLNSACYAMVDYAARQGRTGEEITAAFVAV